MQDTPEKKKIRPLYNAFQGYLQEASISKDANEIFYTDSQWVYLNETIDRLNLITGKNYDQFKIVPEIDRGEPDHVRVSTFKGKLGGLIKYLHAEYFWDDPSPSGNPNMVITQTNQQSQQQHQEQKIEIEQMLRNAQETIAAEYGKEQADKASDFIKKIVFNPKNWSIIANSITGLLAIGKVAFTAALPILGKILHVAN